jgi:hypothetical protein
LRSSAMLRIDEVIAHVTGAPIADAEAALS